MKIIAKIKKFVKNYEREIILFIAVFLISTLAFTFGFLYSKNNFKSSIKIQKIDYEINTFSNHS